LERKEGSIDRDPRRCIPSSARDGVTLGRDTNLNSLLAFKIDRRLSLDLGGRTVVVRPVNTNAEKGLLYRDWVEWNRAYVEKASGGRLGYVHALDMSDGSLAQLHVDLNAQNHAKDGVAVDVRHNDGGFVNAYALDVLSRRGYLFFTSRNGNGTPVRRARSLDSAPSRRRRSSSPTSTPPPTPRTSRRATAR
jgi:tricorn protease